MPHPGNRVKQVEQQQKAKAERLKNGKPAEPPTEEQLEQKRKANLENEKKKNSKKEAENRRKREIQAMGGLDGLLEKVIAESGILKKGASEKSRSMFKGLVKSKAV